MQLIINILIFIVALSMLVVIHELGHFFAAKRFGIKVLEFGFGIPPRIVGKKIGETLVSLNWFPIGGFVRLLGEDEADPKYQHDKHAFAGQAVWKRIVVVLAGVLMNLVTAWLLFYIILGAQGFKADLRLETPHQFIGANQSEESFVNVSGVSDGSPAQQVGLKDGERIIAINDQFVNSANELTQKIQQDKGRAVTLTLSDPLTKEYRKVSVTPRAEPPPGQGALGVTLDAFKITHLEYSEWWQKLFSGIIHTYNMAELSFSELGKRIGSSFTQKSLEPVSDAFGGPIAIGYLSNLILSSPNPWDFLQVVAMISFSLALFNVLPLPALDGGRLAFLVVEAVTRKKVNPKFEAIVHSVGMVLLLALMVLITWSDINKYILGL